MAARIQFGGGRAYATCPDCGEIHKILRRPNVLSKETLRFRCKACGASYVATADEREKLITFFGQKQAVAAPTQPKPKPNKQATTAQTPKQPERKPAELPKQTEKKKKFSILDIL